MRARRYCSNATRTWAHSASVYSSLVFVTVFVVSHLTRQADVTELGLAACGACFRVRAVQGCERLRSFSQAHPFNLGLTR